MTTFDVPAARALCADNEATRELAFVSRTLLPAALDEIERLRAIIDDTTTVDLLLAAVKNECAAKESAMTRAAQAEAALAVEREACNSFRSLLSVEPTRSFGMSEAYVVPYGGFLMGGIVAAHDARRAGETK